MGGGGRRWGVGGLVGVGGIQDLNDSTWIQSQMYIMLVCYLQRRWGFVVIVVLT